MAPSATRSLSCRYRTYFFTRSWSRVPRAWPVSQVTEYRALTVSMPTQHWKQETVFWPSRRCIMTFLLRSPVDWWMCVKRLTFLPVRWLVARMRSSSSGRRASSSVMAMRLMLGRITEWSTQSSIFSPNM